MNYLGVLLILVTVALFVTEIFSSAYALFALAGLVALIMGLLLILQTSVSAALFYTMFMLMLLFIAAGAFFIARRVSASRKLHVATGKEELIGRLAVVRSALHPMGKVFVDGELWNAQISSGKAEVGDHVLITGVDGLVLTVSKSQQEV